MGDLVPTGSVGSGAAAVPDAIPRPVFVIRARVAARTRPRGRVDAPGRGSPGERVLDELALGDARLAGRLVDEMELRAQRPEAALRLLPDEVGGPGPGVEIERELVLPLAHELVLPGADPEPDERVAGGVAGGLPIQEDAELLRPPVVLVPVHVHRGMSR